MLTRPIITARRLIDEFYITKPDQYPLDQIIRARDAFYDEKPMSGADGRIVFRNKQAIVIVNSSIKNPQKKRFVAAHELGHLELHKKPNLYFNCTEENFVEWKSGSKEAEANEFAAEFLMPADLFKMEAAKNRTIFSKEHIEGLSKIFQTSLTSTAIRYTNLGIYSVGVIFSQNGQIKWSCKSDNFVCKYFKSKESVPENSVAYDYYKKNIMETSPRIIMPVWFNYPPVDQYFYEQCVYMPSINCVLSIVWVCRAV